MRRADDLLSIVIVRGRNGFEATVRFKNPVHDFIMYRRSRQLIYMRLDHTIKGRW
jgi:hypothetical protein